MNILCVGCGSLGSHIARYLSMDLPNTHQITVLDFDVVESRNIDAHTQFYFREQKGLPKVEALQYNIYKQYGRKINTIIHKLEPNDELKTFPLFNPFDLIIDCFDNSLARSIIQGYWNEQPLPLLHVGFSDQMTFAIEWAENYQVPTDITSGFDLCTMPGAASFVEMVASLASQTAQQFITSGEKREFVGNRFTIHELSA